MTESLACEFRPVFRSVPRHRRQQDAIGTRAGGHPGNSRAVTFRQPPSR